MNKKAYLDLLKFYLSSLPDGVVGDILSDYEAHFNMALASGKTEEEVARELGDPEAIAKDYLSFEPKKTSRSNEDIIKDKTRKEKIFTYIGIGALILIASPLALVVLATIIALILGFLGTILGIFLGGVGTILGLFIGGGAAIVFSGSGSFSVLTNVLIGLTLISLSVFLAMVFVGLIRWLAGQIRDIYISLKWKWRRKHEG